MAVILNMAYLNVKLIIETEFSYGLGADNGRKLYSISSGLLFRNVVLDLRNLKT